MTESQARTQSSPRQVLLIAAHGSSYDAAARERVTAHARRIEAIVPHDDVLVGFARGAPTIQETLQVIADASPRGRTVVTVVPFMTSTGHYAARVLPDLLRQFTATDAAAASIRYVMTPAIGSRRRIAGLLHRRALRQAAHAGWSRQSTALLLVGHGTPRHAASRTTALSHVRALRGLGWQSADAAFIDDEPGIADTVARLEAARVIVLPFLIGGASHAASDIPVALGFASDATDESRRAYLDGREIILDEPLGVDPVLSDVAADLAIRAWPRATGDRRVRRERDVGEVALVGAGPGAPDLITVRGRRLLRRADVVMYDRLIDEALLSNARPDAQLIDVGKWPTTPQSVQAEINAALVAAARAGQRVVRLKGGDPMVFGRGSEEVDACTAHGVAVHVVPGISSAMAAPVVAGIPLTSRHISRSFAVITAATSTDGHGDVTHLAAVAHVDTIVVLMGHTRLGSICRQLIAAGRDPSTPVACIERATMAGERVVRGTLATIREHVEQAGLAAPMVIVIGPTAAFGA